MSTEKKGIVTQPYVDITLHVGILPLYYVDKHILLNI